MLAERVLHLRHRELRLRRDVLIRAHDLPDSQVAREEVRRIIRPPEKDRDEVGRGRVLAEDPVKHCVARCVIKLLVHARAAVGPEPDDPLARGMR